MITGPSKGFHRRVARSMLVLIALAAAIMAAALLFWPRKSPANPPPPNAPTNLALTAQSNWSIRLTWTDNSGDESGFKVYRKAAGEANYLQVGTPNANGTSSVTWDDTSSAITANTQYTYYVVAFNDAGDSSPSNQPNVTTALPTVSVAAMQTVAESVGTCTVTISLSRASSQSASVSYATSDGASNPKAIAPGDYTSASGTKTFSAGQTSQTVSITIIDDALDEDDESMRLTISSPSGASLGTATQTITITDNDPLPNLTIAADTQTVSEAAGNAVVTVALSAASGRTVTAQYSTGFGTATGGGVDYTSQNGTLTISAGQTSGTVSIPIVNDTTNEENEDFGFFLGTPTNATIDINGPSPGYDYVDIIIDDNDVPVAPTMSAATAQSATSIAVSWNQVTPCDGYKVYHKKGSDSYSFVTTITGGDTTSYTDTGLLANTQYFYKVSAWDSDGESSQSATPVDATTSLPTVAVSQSGSSTVAESAGSISIDLLLSAASSQQATVNYATADGTATAGSDYTATSGTKTFSAGQTSQTVSIPILNDTANEDDETFTLSISSPSGATVGSHSSRTITIDDNDTPPAPTLISVTATGVSTITVVWSAAAWADDYKIERKFGSNGTFTQVGTTTGNASTTFYDQDLNGGDRYYYRVRGHDEDGDGA